MLASLPFSDRSLGTDPLTTNIGPFPDRRN